MSTMTFAFHPFHDPHDVSHTHSLPPNPPSVTAPLTSLHEPKFTDDYESWDFEPTTFSPAQYGPPAGFHHGDETHGLPLDMHLPNASSPLFGSFAPPPEISQLSPSTMLRHDTYDAVLGNPFNPVAPTGLAPQTQPHISFPTPDFPYLAPPPSLPAQTDNRGAQPTNIPMYQPSQPTYGYSPTSAGPSHSHHAHHAHAPTRTAPMYATPIPTAPPQRTSSGGTQGQDQYYSTGPAAYSQPTHSYQQPFTWPTHATETYEVHTPAGSDSSGSGSFARPTPPMEPAHLPPSATVLLN